MYAGVEAEDREKMSNYVNFFSEFKSVIATEAAQLSHQTNNIQTHIDTANNCKQMLDSIETQTNVVNELVEKH